jgi:DNA-directed RNA polymerase subunit F
MIEKTPQEIREHFSNRMRRIDKSDEDIEDIKEVIQKNTRFVIEDVLYSLLLGLSADEIIARVTISRALQKLLPLERKRHHRLYGNIQNKGLRLVKSSKTLESNQIKKLKNEINNIPANSMILRHQKQAETLHIKKPMKRTLHRLKINHYNSNQSKNTS